MKRTSAFICGIIVCAIFSARTATSRSFVPANTSFDPLTTAILANQVNAAAPVRKSTALKHRLIATSYKNQNVLQDSVHFYFGSNTRGTDLPHPYSYFDKYVPYDYGNFYSNFSSYPGYFYNIQNIKSDSTVHWDNSTGPFKKITATSYTYNANNDAIGAVYYNAAAAAYTTALTMTMAYTGSDLNHFTYVTPTANQAGDLVYNAQSRLVQDSVYNVIGGAYVLNTYSYSASNDLLKVEQVKSTDATKIKFDYTYNANHLLTSATKSTYNGSTWVYAKTDTFSYTGSNPIYSSFSDYTWSTAFNDWTPVVKCEYHFNAQQNWDTAYQYVDNSGTWSLLEKDYTVYNGNGFIDEVRGINFDGVQYAAAPYDRNAFYYEDYNDPTVVSNMVSDNELEIFPNPAGTYIDVRINGIPAAEQITLIDANGRIVLRQASTLNAGNQRINIGSLPAGMYLLSLQDNKGNIRAHRQFIKE